MNFRKSIIGSSIAFIVATSCCWLPVVIIAFGGGSKLIGLSNGLENFSGIFMIVGLGLLGYGTYQFIKRKKIPANSDVILKSTITCPECGHQKEEIMPTDACQFFYDCQNCKVVLKPNNGDCCVFCSFGTVPCPPIQNNKNCGDEDCC